jgi:2,3-dihydroxybenzoate-AMP ligase
VLAHSPSPDEIFPLVEREHPTLTTVMPTFLKLWSETAPVFGADLSGLHVEVGGAPLDPEAARTAQAALGVTLTHWFGMAEGVLCCTRPADGIDAAARVRARRSPRTTSSSWSTPAIARSPRGRRGNCSSAAR